MDMFERRSRSGGFAVLAFNLMMNDELREGERIESIDTLCSIGFAVLDRLKPNQRFRPINKLKCGELTAPETRYIALERNWSQKR